MTSAPLSQTMHITVQQRDCLQSFLCGGLAFIRCEGKGGKIMDLVILGYLS